MYTYVLLILVMLSLPISTFAACAIESQTPPLLTAYIQKVMTDTKEIQRLALGRNRCTGEAGSFSSEKRFLGLIDRIDLENPTFPDLATDFQYRLILTTDGESRSPVMRQGEVIQGLEIRTIIPAMKSIANACALDTILTNGTAEEQLTNLLRNNKNLESYFKRVATGNPSRLGEEGLSEELLDEIEAYYSPSATKGCTNDSTLDNLAQKSKSLLESIMNFGKTTENANDNWKIAISLFRGTAKNYNDTQKKLLSEELARQGVTKSAADSMVSSLSCMQKNAGEAGSVEEWAKSRAACAMPLILGGKAKVKEIFSLIPPAKTTDGYLQRRLEYQKKISRASRDMPAFWASIETKLYGNSEERMNEKIITDLIQMHISISTTNTLLEKKLPDMQKNCMKAQPEIRGGCISTH